MFQWGGNTYTTQEFQHGNTYVICFQPWKHDGTSKRNIISICLSSVEIFVPHASSIMKHVGYNDMMLLTMEA